MTNEQEERNALGFLKEDQPSMDQPNKNPVQKNLDQNRHATNNKMSLQGDNKQDKAKPKNAWDEMKAWAKKHPIAATAIVGATMFSGGGLITLATLGAAGAGTIPIMVGGGFLITGAVAAGACYTIYRGVKALYKWGKKKYEQRQNTNQNKASQKTIDKALEGGESLTAEQKKPIPQEPSMDVPDLRRNSLGSQNMKIPPSHAPQKSGNIPKAMYKDV